MGCLASETVYINSVTCANCGVVFGLPSHLETRRREDGQNFYCPNGHVLSWKESELDKVKKQLAQETKKREWAEQAEKTERAARETAERKLRRTARGVCTECRRTFINLQRHMHSKHREIAKAAAKPTSP